MYRRPSPPAGSDGHTRDTDRGALFAAAGPLATSNYSQLSTLSPGVLRGDGYALQNAYNSLETNSASNASAPDVTQVLKWANPTTLLSLPQTRYSFFANGKFFRLADVATIRKGYADPPQPEPCAGGGGACAAPPPPAPAR